MLLAPAIMAISLTMYLDTIAEHSSLDYTKEGLSPKGEWVAASASSDNPSREPVKSKITTKASVQRAKS